MAVLDMDYDVDVVLAEDGNGVALKELQDTLQQGMMKVKRAIDAGLAPNEFKKAEALRMSFETATIAVDKIWKAMHS